MLVPVILKRDFGAPKRLRGTGRTPLEGREDTCLPISHGAEVVAEKVTDGDSPCFAEATTLTLEEAREKAR